MKKRAKEKAKKQYKTGRATGLKKQKAKVPMKKNKKT